jgi:hypothetical protein
VYAQAVYSCQALEHDAEHYLEVSTSSSSPPRATAARMPLTGQRCPEAPAPAPSGRERSQGAYSLQARTGAGEDEQEAALGLSDSAQGQCPAIVHETSIASPVSLFGIEHTRRPVGAEGRGIEAAPGRISLQEAQSLLHSSTNRTLFGPGGARGDGTAGISLSSTTTGPHRRIVVSTRPPTDGSGRCAGLLPDVSKFCSGCGGELVRNSRGEHACRFCTACGRRV